MSEEENKKPEVEQTEAVEAKPEPKPEVKEEVKEEVQEDKPAEESTPEPKVKEDKKPEVSDIPINEAKAEEVSEPKTIVSDDAQKQDEAVSDKKAKFVPEEAPDEVPEKFKTEEKPAEKKTDDKRAGRGGRGRRGQRERPAFDKEAWKPKTEIGRKVKAGEIKDIDEILDNGLKIMEAEIVDALIPTLETDLLLIGQSKGKFGGGQRRVFKQTQKKTPEGNKPKFGTFAVVGNKDGFVGIGPGKAKETVPAREKAFRNAKLNIIKIRRGCGSWECNCKTPHSIPYAIEGKVGSVYIKLMPAPKGAGLVAEKECQKILEMAGIKDVYSLTIGQTQTKINLISACMDALKKLMSTKVNPQYVENLGIIEGSIKKKGVKDE